MIFLMGSTACGKTDLAAALSERFPVELISVDAAQIYQGMDIGTAKPSQSFLRQYPHHLIDIRRPSETYSAAEFTADAKCLIGDIHLRGRVPLLVGGTMFYFHALEFGLPSQPSSDPVVRRHLWYEWKERGITEMYDQLQAVDPTAAARINANDSQRVLRALEIHRLAGHSSGESIGLSKLTSPPIKIALFDVFREQLHQRIRDRFETMLKLGFVEEVTALANSFEEIGRLPSMRTVGYRQVLELLQGKIGRHEMTERAVAATRQLAKRQLTWLRQQRGLVWVRRDQHEGTLEIVSNYLLDHSKYGSWGV